MLVYKLGSMGLKLGFWLFLWLLTATASSNAARLLLSSTSSDYFRGQIRRYLLENGLVALLPWVAIAYAFALFAVVSVSMHVSGSQVNLAITFNALLGGRISFFYVIPYWIAQLLGAIVTSLLLKLITNGMRLDLFHVAYGKGVGHTLVFEIVMAFGLMYIIYATAIDLKRGVIGTLVPLAIGLIVVANILVGGPFNEASMNPTRAFGPSLVGSRWRHHWIYWVGPFIGAGLAALVYEYIVFPTEPSHTHQPLALEDY